MNTKRGVAIYMYLEYIPDNSDSNIYEVPFFAFFIHTQ